MIKPEDKPISDSKEMYLVTIARLSKPDQPVPISHLAQELSVTSVSVNEMCRKLQDEGYLMYQPYHGVMLTEAGQRLANSTLRRHRLWEVFLVDKLGLEFPQAHQIACQMEHLTTDLMIDKLDQFLDFPKVNPIGYPIPSRNSESIQATGTQLTKLAAGRSAQVSSVNGPEAIRLYLSDVGVFTGAEITLIGVGHANILVMVKDDYVSLSSDIAQNILVDQLA